MSRSINSTLMASTSKVADSDAFADHQDKSTDKEVEKQTEPNGKKKKGIGVVTGWLRMVEPRKVPYFPQLKDKIVYLRQAHENYLKEVADRKIFDVAESDKLWVQMKIDAYEYLTVTNIKFKKYPTRVASLEVRRINKENQAFGPNYKLKYHDMGDVIDFLVLKPIFVKGMQKNWNVGDRFRYLVSNRWFFGTIRSKEPFEKRFPDSPFKCFQIKWDDERELDQLSPWEFEAINKSRIPKNHGEWVDVLNIEIVSMRYQPDDDEWLPWKDRKTAIKKIVSELNLLMDLTISRCFIEIKKEDPVYDALVSYPVDLSTIKERLEKHFYRRIDSVMMDINYLKNNAEEEYNAKNKNNAQKRFEEAQLIAKICEDILKDKDTTSSFEELKKFLDNNSYNSDSDSDVFKLCNKKGRQINSKNNWRTDCRQMLDILWGSEDALPFRQHVCREEYPDYYEIITKPICLEDIKRKFYSKLYETPKPMFEDIKLLISNSRKYNQDKEKAIYLATTSISNLFEALKKQVNWRKESPRKKMKKKNEFVTKQYCPKSYQERVESQTVKEKDCSSLQIDVQKKGPSKRKIEHDETILSNKRIDLKNNNYRSGPTEKLPDKSDDIISADDTSSSGSIMQNKENEILNSSKSNFDDSSVEIKTKNLPQETPKPNEHIMMEVNESDSNVNNNDDSDSDSVIVIDIENDDSENPQTSGSIEADLTRSGTHSIESSHQDISKRSTESSHQDISKTLRKKSLRLIKIRKRWQHQFKHVFKTRPCKSCDICQSIKRTYLSHFQTHHT